MKRNQDHNPPLIIYKGEILKEIVFKNDIKRGGGPKVVAKNEEEERIRRNIQWRKVVGR